MNFSKKKVWFPRVWYFRGLQYRIRRMYLIRGGRYVKIETSSLANDRMTVWAENKYFNILTEDTQHFDDKDNAEFLTEEGQLKYELTVQMDHYREWGVNSNDVVIYLWFKK